MNFVNRKSFNFKFWLDWGTWVLATPFAFLVRFDGTIPPTWVAPLLFAMAFVVPLKMALLLGTRIHLQTWRSPRSCSAPSRFCCGPGS